MNTQRSSFCDGLQIRQSVVGVDRVAHALGNANAITLPLQELVTSFAWGEIWTRPELDLRSRSIATIGMLIGLGKADELKVHFMGGLNNGLTIVELREIVIHSAIYAGFPAALGAMQVLRSVAENHPGDGGQTESK